MTFRLFNRLYTHYKNTFDIEMLMAKAGKTYADIKKKQDATDEWF